MEETLASYLSVGETSSLKAPSLPSKPLQKYAAAGQAVASLHTMVVLEAYQADLLKDRDKENPGLSPNKAGVRAHLHLDRDGHRRLVSWLVPLPPSAGRARGRRGSKRGRGDPDEAFSTLSSGPE